MAGPGDILVFAFLALAASSAALRAAHLFRPAEGRPLDYRKASRLLLFAALADLLVLLVVWEVLLLTSDLSYLYVWEHSAVEHPALWKAEGLWAGQEGSVFVWALVMTAAVSINEVWTARRARRAAAARGPTRGRREGAGRKGAPDLEKVESDLRLGDWTALFATLVITTFAIVLAASDWFRRTADDPLGPLLLSTFPTGFGLSPSLRTELNAIHPPIELAAFALTVLPMSAAFAYLATGDKGWIRYCTFWTRIAWVFLTTGLALGGLWAYITLGWGGYWAWDPVEVASLLPWLATTALLHAQLMHRRHRMYPLAAPLLAAIAFSLTEFGTFVTRSGAWNSVHSFIQNQQPDLIAAIGTALGSDLRLAVFFAMAFVPLAILLLLLNHFLRHHYEEAAFLPPRGKDEDLVDYLAQDKFAVFAGIFSLCVILLMTIVILVREAGSAPQPAEYETKLAAPVFVIMFFMTVNFLRRPLGNEDAMLVAIGAVFVGAMAFILWPAPPTNPYWKLAGPAVVFAGAVFLMGAVRVRGALGRRMRSSLRARARTLAVISVHVGVACLLLGYALSNTLVRDDRVIVQEGGAPSQAGTDVAFGYRFELVGVVKDPDAGQTAREFWDKFEARYRMFDAGSGALVREGYAFIIYQRPSPAPSPENFAFTNYVAAPIIHTDVFTTATHDLYIQVNNILPGVTNGTVAVELAVKQIPGVWGVWGGVVLMVGGMVTLMGVEYRAARKGGGDLPAVDVGPPPVEPRGSAKPEEGPSRAGGNTGP
ncbi:MAG TPA: cytochrome c biogenesis protein CcsA [Candidatus Thermoplasmatota archaeon]